MLPRPVRVQAVIERPPAPPWIAELPFPSRADWWPGNMLAWRWVDRSQRTWTALVRYTRDGLTYEHWLSGDLLDVEPEKVPPLWAQREIDDRVVINTVASNAR